MNERLSQELRNRADQAGGHPISLDDVKRSATKMKWQQRAAAGAVAAVVLAVGIPAGIAITNNGATNGRDPVVTPTPTVATPTPTPTPADGKKVQLTANVEAHAPQPGIITSSNGEIVLPDGTAIPTGQNVDDVVYDAAANHWVGIVPGPNGDWELRGFRADGTSTDASYAVSPNLAVSADGDEYAYFTTDDRTLHFWSAGFEERTWQFAKGVDVNPIGITAQGVIYETFGEEPVLMMARIGGGEAPSDTQPILGFIGGGAVYAAGNLAAGQTSYNDNDGTSCWGVRNLETGADLWNKCDYMLTAFSPDGRYIVGNNSDFDGIGAATVAVLDAETGELVVEFAADTRAGSFISNTVWDVDGSLLTMLYDEGWALMRLTIDGGFANVSTGRIAGEPESTPLFFEARP